VNILMITAYPPVLHMHGGGVRMYHNIRLLSESHSVRVISFVENDHERDLLGTLEGICESVTPVQRVPDFSPHWLSLDPFLVREFSTPEMDEAIDAALRKKRVDVLQCEYLQMAQYRRRGIFSVLTILETLSANAYESFRREVEPTVKFKLFYRWMQMLRYEVLATRRFDRVVTMTEHDAQYLRSYAPMSNIRAIPIGIDPAEFEPLPEEPIRPLEVLFVGNFRHTPNVEAARFLAQEMASFFPSIRFVLLGSNAPGDLRIAPNTLFPGYVPDTRVMYHRPNTIVAAPLFSGTGQRVKLLEAFSMGCPVITTSVGALGFPIRSGIEALVANSAEEFRVALTRLTASEELRRTLGRNAREMVVKHFDWAQIGAAFNDMLSFSD
jgi:glycosyltransferase involved in cell wall biosynthesis